MFTLNAYAKVNLSLGVIGIRNDGYHVIRSIMSYVDLFDLIRIKKNNLNSPTLFVLGQFGKHFNNHDIEQVSNNIIIKTLQNLRIKYGIPIGFDIVLEKNIPIASGMGGGSSNAAVIIRFCNEYYDLGLSISEMMIDAVKIGADVPFFLNDRISLCEGIGEIVTPFDTKGDLYAVILNPMVEIRAADAYCKLDHMASSTVSWYKDEDSALSKIKNYGTLSINELVRLTKSVGNDLVRPSSEIAPIISDILNDLKNTDGMLLSQMSGSGATCFALYDNYDAARQSLYKMRVLYPFAFGGVFKLLTKVNHGIIDDGSFYELKKQNWKMAI